MVFKDRFDDFLQFMEQRPEPFQLPASRPAAVQVELPQCVGLARLIIGVISRVQGQQWVRIVLVGQSFVM